jgi:hypothetical protein
MKNAIHQLPETGFLRLKQIVGDKKAGIPPLIPICRTGWYNGVAEGRFPASVKLGPRTSAWKVEDIRALMEKLAEGGESYSTPNDNPNLVAGRARHIAEVRDGIKPAPRAKRGGEK